MKIKIIDILNKIANGEEPPKKIYYKSEIFEYDEKEKDYVHIDFTEYLFDVYLITDILNDEVEILETTITYNQDNYYQYQPYTGEVEIKCNSPKNILESGKIEKISQEDIETYMFYGEQLCANKINEIIDYLKEIK